MSIANTVMKIGMQRENADAESLSRRLHILVLNIYVTHAKMRIEDVIILIRGRLFTVQTMFRTRKLRLRMSEQSEQMKVASDALLASTWLVGYKDRGHGHGDFAVITQSGTLVVECVDRELANHIVTTHNNSITGG